MERKAIDELRRSIWENQKWPQKYIFKFIVQNKDGKVDKVVSLLPKGAKLSYKHTKNLNHIAITAIAVLESLEKVKEVNLKVSEIQGVISL